MSVSVQREVNACNSFIHSAFTMLTRCSAIAERPRCRVRYSFRQK